MAGVERVVVAFAEAWNRHDMVEFSEFFAPDAEFVTRGPQKQHRPSVY